MGQYVHYISKIVYILEKYLTLSFRCCSEYVEAIFSSFMVHLMTMSVAQTIQVQVIGLSMNIELKRIWKKVLMI